MTPKKFKDHCYFTSIWIQLPKWKQNLALTRFTFKKVMPYFTMGYDHLHHTNSHLNYYFNLTPSNSLQFGQFFYTFGFFSCIITSFSLLQGKKSRLKKLLLWRKNWLLPIESITIKIILPQLIFKINNELQNSFILKPLDCSMEVFTAHVFFKFSICWISPPLRCYQYDAIKMLFAAF